jgi:hypothetical protein
VVPEDSPLALASSCRTERQAARAAAALEAEISLGERSEDWYDLADEALDDLHRRFPGFTRLDSYRLPRPLAPAARRELDKPSRRRHRGLELAAAVAAILTAILLGIRHARRHPRRTAAGALVLVSLVSGHPTWIGTAGVIAAMVILVRKRPGMFGPLRPPRAPRMPQAPRMLQRPRL